MEVLAFTNAPWLIPCNFCRIWYLQGVCRGWDWHLWDIEHPIDFWRFRDVLSKQMLQYLPTYWLFPVDNKSRASTLHMKRKYRRVTSEIECLDNVTYSMFDVAKNKPNTRSGSARLCGYLTYFERHVESQAQRKNPRPCEACGSDSCNICGLCNVPIQFFPQIWCHTKKTCFLKYN